jgi:peptidylprolyl isomerase
MIGEGSVIPIFEMLVVGLSPGEKRSEKIPWQKGFGPRREDKVYEMERSQFSEKIDPKVGETVRIKNDYGKKISVTITEITDDKVTLDANHPLAGKDIIFEVELLKIDE